MPRIRYLKPEFFSDEDLSELPFETRLAYAGLWCFADREGRLEDRPKYLKAMIFPYDDIDMEQQLDILSKPKSKNGNPFITRYSIDHLNLIQILNWHKHQNPHSTERESIFPPAIINKDKDNYKDKDKGLKASPELRNGYKTVKRTLKKTEIYNCPYFIEFWKLYPKKIGKGKTWEEWIKISIKKDDILIKTISNVINRFKQTDQWQKDNGQYIPHPATWLHQRRWEDEIPKPNIDPTGPKERMTDDMRLQYWSESKKEWIDK